MENDAEGVIYSIIVLLEEENKAFSQFIFDLNELFLSQNQPFEIIIIANGTEGILKNKLDELQELGVRLKAFSFNKKINPAVCIRAGFQESKGQIFVVCGSYQQITIDSFKKLIGALDNETDVISPWRQNRVDPLFNQFQSRIFNTLVQKVSGYELHDLSNTVRVFRRKVFEETDLYGGMYRFLPILAAQKGFKFKEIKCGHCQEHGKTGFYSLSEYISRILDIITLYFNIRFTKKPLRFFSTIGLIFLAMGLLIISYVFFQKIFLNYPIGGRAVLLLAILFMMLGVQAASAGLLGEIVTFVHGRQKKEYTIEKKI